MKSGSPAQAQAPEHGGQRAGIVSERAMSR
jgi:hypothetical protein